MNDLRLTIRYELYDTIRNGRIEQSSNLAYHAQSSGRPILLVMEDELLIEAVRGYQCLWQVNCRSYKDNRAKENAWKEVSKV